MIARGRPSSNCVHVDSGVIKSRCRFVATPPESRARLVPIVLLSILLLSCQPVGRPPDLMLPTEPQATATTLDVLVQELECASGESAAGRIEVRGLEETADEVRLRIIVRQRPGNQNCQGSPPTPFSIDLSRPLGERTVVDIGGDRATPLPVVTSGP